MNLTILGGRAGIIRKKKRRRTTVKRSGALGRKGAGRKIVDLAGSVQLPRLPRRRHQAHLPHRIAAAVVVKARLAAVGGDAAPLTRVGRNDVEGITTAIRRRHHLRPVHPAISAGHLAGIRAITNLEGDDDLAKEKKEGRSTNHLRTRIIMRKFHRLKTLHSSNLTSPSRIPQMLLLPSIAPKKSTMHPWMRTNSVRPKTSNRPFRAKSIMTLTPPTPMIPTLVPNPSPRTIPKLLPAVATQHPPPSPTGQPSSPARVRPLHSTSSRIFASPVVERLDSAPRILTRSRSQASSCRGVVMRG
mmetsp:Transcript_43/g.88  ORF Transcript_43/g.88 Transcript_43/m.88 type:complete len:301 (+) Transcript_43:265-1167(+)